VNRIKKSVFDDRDILIEIWKERRAAGDAYIELMWKGAQFFFLIISALISVSFVAIGSIWQITDILAQLGFLFALMFLGVMVIAFCWLGKEVAKRKQDRFRMMVAHVSKVEALLGLSQDIGIRLKRADVFPGDTFLFQEFVESYRGLNKKPRYNTEREWVENNQSNASNTYTNLRTVYLFLAVAAFALLIFEIAMALHLLSLI